MKGFVTHKLDFAHLWAAFRERGVSDDEEVVIFWTAKHYRFAFMKLFSRLLPKMVVTIRPKGSLEILNKLCDPEWKPGSGETEAAVRASLPIVELKPAVMK